MGEGIRLKPCKRQYYTDKHRLSHNTDNTKKLPLRSLLIKSIYSTNTQRSYNNNV